MTDALAFEDSPADDVVEYGGVNASAPDIIAFAREFDRGNQRGEEVLIFSSVVLVARRPGQK